MTPAETKLRKARSHVVQLHPFFGGLLLRQRLVETGKVETMATNGKELFFNPEWVLERTPDELDFVCAHEALHPGLGHHVRRGERDPDLWNQATDYCINPILVEAGLHAPEDALMRDDLEGNAEQIYRTLKEEQAADAPPPEPDPPADDIEAEEQMEGEFYDDDDDDTSDNDQDDDSDDADQGQGDDTSDDGNDDSDDSDQAGDAQGDPDEGDGEPDDTTPDYGGCGAVMDADFGNEAERNAEENDWRVALTQAANFAAAAGSLPGQLERHVHAVLNPRANWRELLRRYMDAFAKADYSWQQPNRRFIANGTYLPSMKSDQLPPIVFVIDASMSMPEYALDQAASELQSIVDELQPEFVDVVIHDESIRGEVRRAEPGDAIDYACTAGGGTCFAPVCDFLNNADEQYAACVWFTDLEAWDWDQCDAPDVPIVFLDFTGRNESLAKFGDEVITMEDET